MQVLKNCTPRYKRTREGVARRLLLQLVSIDGTGRVSRSMKMNLVDPQSDKTEKTILRKLVDARLVVLDVDGAQIAHEALLQEWPQFSMWMEEEWAWLRMRDEIAADAEEWARHERDPSLLYAGSRLFEAEYQSRGYWEELSDVTREFLRSAVRQRESYRRQRILVLLGLALSLLANGALLVFLLV